MKIFLTLLFVLTSYTATANWENSLERVDIKELKAGSKLVSNKSMSMRNEFFSKNIQPFNGYEKVLVGPLYKASAFSKYDFYRLVTHYNIIRKEEKISHFPIIYEECYDYGDRFANISRDIRIEGRLSASFKLFELGVSTEFVQGQTFQVGRSIRATKGIEARHITYLYYENWIGKTYVQYFDIDKKTKKWQVATTPTFILSKVNPTLRVKREIINQCEE